MQCILLLVTALSCIDLSLQPLTKGYQAAMVNLCPCHVEGLLVEALDAIDRCAIFTATPSASRVRRPSATRHGCRRRRRFTCPQRRKKANVRVGLGDGDLFFASGAAALNRMERRSGQLRRDFQIDLGRAGLFCFASGSVYI